MIKIEPIPAFDDNYIWCLFDTETQQAAVVDPGQSLPVISFLKQHQLTLTAVLVTHHHFDHVGGLQDLKQQFNPTIHGPCNPQINTIDFQYKHGNQLSLFGSTFTIMEIPGHTLDHIAFYSEDIHSDPVVFCGDTLFAGGCGRIFEGTPEMMLSSLQLLSELPPATKLYCAHEYTLANLAFANVVDPNNTQLQQRTQQDADKRKQNLPTIPSTLATEKETNPFLRSHVASIAMNASQHCKSELNSKLEVFTAIREWKNNF